MALPREVPHLRSGKRREAGQDGREGQPWNHGGCHQGSQGNRTANRVNAPEVVKEIRKRSVGFSVKPEQ